MTVEHSETKALATRRLLMVGAPLAVVGAAVGVVMVLGATAPKPEKKDGAVKPPAVQVGVVELRNTRLQITVQGEARPRTQAALAAQVAGRVVWTSPAFVNGGAFRTGQELVRIDDADYRLSVVRARAQVAQAREGLAREEAEARLARADWETLGQGEASPLALREPQLAQARATVAAAEAQLRAAELDLERTAVRAPFDGRVKAKRANVGDYVGPGVAVGEVFATDVAEIRVPLTDADLATLQTTIGFNADARRPGPVAEVTASVGGAKRSWRGRLVRTEAAIDPQTRLAYGVIEVRDPFGGRGAAPLAPGLFVTAAIGSPRMEPFLATPRSALKRNEFVYVVKPDDTIDVRTLRAAQTTGDEALFRAGLAAGERVVVSVLPAARQGMKVTPIARSASAATAVDAARTE